MTTPPIKDICDLWAYATRCVKSGEANNPESLRRLLLAARDTMPQHSRTDDADVSKMVEAALKPLSDDIMTDLEKPKPKPPAGPEASEAALAEHLAMSSLNRLLRWDRHRGAWMEWTGTHWRTSLDKVPLKLQASIRRAVADGVETKQIDPKTALRLESHAAMRGVAALLAAFPSVWLIGDGQETDPPGLIACPRGVLDLSTQQWMEHDSKRPITRICPVDPGPMCEMWGLIQGHLSRCLGETYTAVHRYLGSALLGRSADRRLLWLHGSRGSDGKSTLVRALRAALGEHLAVIPAEVFRGEARGAHGHELSSGLASSRLAVALELGEDINWALLKTLSGGDAQTTKRLHARAFTITRPPLLMLVSNDPPRPPDNASAERVILGKMVPPDETDERLVQVLTDGGKPRDALAGACLSWLIAGCAEYVEHGLGAVPSIATVPPGLELWWQASVEAGEIIPGHGLTTLVEAVAHFAAWAERNQPGPVTRHEVSRFLSSRVGPARTNAKRGYRLTITETSDGE